MTEEKLLNAPLGIQQEPNQSINLLQSGAREKPSHCPRQAVGTVHKFGENVWPYMPSLPMADENSKPRSSLDQSTSKCSSQPMPSRLKLTGKREAAPLCQRCEVRVGRLECRDCFLDHICVQCSSHVHAKNARLHHKVSLCKPRGKLSESSTECSIGLNVTEAISIAKK